MPESGNDPPRAKILVDLVLFLSTKSTSLLRLAPSRRRTPALVGRISDIGHRDTASGGSYQSESLLASR